MNERQRSQKQRVCSQTTYARCARNRTLYTLDFPCCNNCPRFSRKVRGLGCFYGRAPTPQEAQNLIVIHFLHDVMDEGIGQRSAAIASNSATHDKSIRTVAANEGLDLLNHSTT